jgi:hypothetical protein
MDAGAQQGAARGQTESTGWQILLSPSEDVTDCRRCTSVFLMPLNPRKWLEAIQNLPVDA